jgi:transcriptional accessory protein Tex/SPT6
MFCAVEAGRWTGSAALPVVPEEMMTETNEQVMPEGAAAEVDATPVESAAVEAEVSVVLDTQSDAVPDLVADQSPVVEAAEVGAETAQEEASASEDAMAESKDDSAPAELTAAVEMVDDDGKRVVRTLAVGQEVLGTVRRVSEFGAFVDIGVGRDGLVHISELSVKRVGKVTDVLSEGQQVPMWIKKLDRDRNRISLTMIPPGTMTLRDLNKDDLVTGTVTRILPYGAFVDIGVGRDALLHVREMGERYIAKPEEVVKVGEVIEARIIEIQRRRGRVDLSIKGLREEPEPEPRADQPQAKAEPVAEEPEAELVDAFADVEVLSPMELAFRKAMEASGVDYKLSKKSDKSAQATQKYRSEQEEIMARTLKAGR